MKEELNASANANANGSVGPGSIHGGNERPGQGGMSLNLSGLGAMGGMPGLNSNMSMGNMSAMNSMSGGGGSNQMSQMNMSGMGGGNMSSMGGGGMPNMSAGMGGGSMGLGGGLPGSPRIGAGGGMGNMGAMGPPGLPRSISSDSMGGIGGGMGAMGVGMMNGAHGSPRPPSSMGMGVNIDDSRHHPQTPVRSGVAAMGGGGMGGGMGQPQTPLRQGSLPPTQGTPTQLAQLQQMQSASLQQQQQLAALTSAGRQGSLPPTGMQPGMRGGMGGVNPMGMPSSPHAGSGAPGMAASLSGSGPSLASAAGPGLPISAPGLTATASASGSLPQVNGAGVASGSGLTASAPGLSTANLPPLPPGLNAQTTSISLVPLSGAGSGSSAGNAIPELNPDDISTIHGWMKTDRAYDARVRAMQTRMLDEVRGAFAPGTFLGSAWWERGAPGSRGNPNPWRKRQEGFDLKYPKLKQGPPTGRTGRKGRREGFRMYVLSKDSLVHHLIVVIFI